MFSSVRPICRRRSAISATHPEVQKVIGDGIRRVRAAGKAPGILTADETLAKRYLELGALFVAVGIDVNLLTRMPAPWRSVSGRLTTLAMTTLSFTRPARFGAEEWDARVQLAQPIASSRCWAGTS